MKAYIHEIPQSKAPALHAAIGDLCHKAGIPRPTVSYIDTARVENPLLQFIYDHMIGAMNVDKPRIILGEKIRRMMNHHNLSDPISEEFKAVLAHEIGHLKYGDVNLGKIIPLRTAPIMGIVAGMGGVWYYQHLKDKAEKEKAAGKDQKDIDANIQKELSSVDQNLDEHTAVYKNCVTAAKYVAGGLLGFALGAAVFAIGHRHIEFRADRTSAELMGSGEPLARALKSLRTKLQESINANPEIKELARKRNPIVRFLQQFSHPSDMERIGRLTSWSRT